MDLSRTAAQYYAADRRLDGGCERPTGRTAVEDEGGDRSPVLHMTQPMRQMKDDGLEAETTTGCHLSGTLQFNKVVLIHISRLR
jgi:hypothetical protein